MADIIFTYTECSTHSSQGMTATGQEGYDIWVRYNDDRMMCFIGFTPPEDLGFWMEAFAEKGDRVYIRDKE